MTTVTNSGTTNYKPYRYKIDVEIDYALLWAYHQTKLDGIKRYVYESVSGVAISLSRLSDGKMYWTDGEKIGVWPAGWDEGFRDHEIEGRVLDGPELQFN